MRERRARKVREPWLVIRARGKKGNLRTQESVTICFMTALLEDALRKVAALPQDEQDAIALQIIETLRDEAAWKEKLARDPEKLRRLAEEAQQEHRRGETRPLDELL